MKHIIHTPDAPAPIGPYSQAVQAGPFLFVSGQIAIVPSSGELQLESLELETQQVMRNIGAILQSNGMDFSDIVKTTIYLRDMANFATVNGIYGSFFNADHPARETVAVLGLPKDVNVEISVIAYRG